MQLDSEAVAMPKGISASKRAAAEAEAPAPKRLRTLTPSRQEPDAEAGNSASSRAEQQAAAQQAAAAAASEPDLVISASEDDSDVEIIGETPAPDVLLVSETQADDVLEMKPSPQQLAAQAARQQKGKGIAGSQQPKPDPEQSNNSWNFTEFDFLPLYGLSEQQLACRKQNAASSSRGVSRQHALLQAFEEHRAQQMAAALQLEQEQAADAAAAAAAAAGDGMLELDSEDEQPATAAAAADEEDMVIEDSQAEEESASDAEFMPQQQQPQPPQKRQPEQQQRQRQRQQQERPAEGAAVAAAAAGRRRRPAAPPPPRARQQPPPRQQQQQQQQRQQRLAAPEPGDPRQRLNRKLRAELHHLQESALQQEEALTDPKSGRLIGFMEQAAVLGKSAERPRENAVQTGVLATFAGLGSRMIASYRSTTAGNRPVDLLTALKRQFGQPGLLQQPQQQHGASALDWAGIGAAAAAAGMWRGAPGVSSMLGPLQQEAKVRKAAQRRQRAPVAAQVTPDENPLAKTAETQETDKWVETMLQVLSRCPPRVTLVALVVNHCSFSQTVENIFALSFLVKDMWCKLEKDPQRGLLVTCLTTEQRQAAMQQHEQQGGAAAAAAAAAAAGASSGAHQFMLNIDMALWHDMCRVVAPGDALMPHREPVVQEQQQQQQQ